MATDQDRAILAAVRSRLDQASFGWQLSRDGEKLEATLVPNTRPVTIVTLTTDCGHEDRDFLVNAHADITFLLRLLGEAFRTIRMQSQGGQSTQLQRRQAAPAGEAKDFAAECAMKCGDQLFRRYLIERHALVDATDEIRVATRVRSILAVKSRGELNTDPNAAARWKNLRADFDAWRNYP
jgi:hypothetical protein